MKEWKEKHIRPGLTVAEIKSMSVRAIVQVADKTGKKEKAWRFLDVHTHLISSFDYSTEKIVSILNEYDFELVMPELKLLKQKKENTSVNESRKIVATRLFEFWKVCTGHLKSKINDASIRMICDRLKEGYSENQLAQAIVGITLSEFENNRGKYDGLKYIAKESEKVDRLSAKAEKAGYNESIVENLMISLQNGNFTGLEKDENHINTKTGAKLV